jgi:hypothetical protein
MPRRLIVGFGLLVLTTGCYTAGVGRAADLPQTRPLPMQSSGVPEVPGVQRPVGSGLPSPAGDIVTPVRHPPDAIITAREPHAPRETRLDGAVARAVRGVNWALFAVVIAF